MPFNWKDAPGSAPADRRRATIKKLLGSFLVGALSLGVAWAGTGLGPVNDFADSSKSDSASGNNFVGLEDGSAEEVTTDQALEPLEPGQIYAGASKISLYPRPDDYQTTFPGATWEKDQEKCETLAPNQTAVEQTATHIADTRVKWGENPDCLYMGGYGLGPMNSITSWDLAPEDDLDPTDNQVPDGYGLWVRSVAMQDATGDTVVLTLIDAIYWEAHYNSLCPGDPCGFLDIAEQLAAETGLPAKSFMFASTHSHTSMDFIGGWGAVPDWYMQQATDTLKAAATQAVASLEPAVLEAGEEIVRDRNGERRDFYRSAEDDNMSWLRLVDADNQPRPEVCTTPTPEPTATPTPSPTKKPHHGSSQHGSPSPTASPTTAPTPVCEPAAPGRAIATVGAYAAHPVTEDADGGQADADFPAVFAKSVEDAYGGVGMFLQTGLGNESPRGGGVGVFPNACSDGVDNDGDGNVDHPADIGCDNPGDNSEYSDKEQMGLGLASHIPAIGGGQQIADTDLRVGQKHWDQPATNAPLTALGASGFFDRKFNQLPASVSVGKSGYENKRCHSASPMSVDTSVSAVKIGSLWITGGPGELFSNLTNTIEERNPNGVTLALGLVNDGLGYIIQSFETDEVGRQGAGFVGDTSDAGVPAGLAEYEDAYSIDHCFGDAALEYTIQLLGSL